MSDLPEIDESLAGIFPFEARLESPHGALRLGSLSLTNGTPLRVVGRLRGGGYLAQIADHAWVRVPEHWLTRVAGAYTERAQ